MTGLPEWKLSGACLHYDSEERAREIAGKLTEAARETGSVTLHYHVGEAVNPEGRRVWLVWHIEGTGKWCPVCHGKGSVGETHSGTGLTVAQPCYFCCFAGVPS